MHATDCAHQPISFVICLWPCGKVLYVCLYIYIYLFQWNLIWVNLAPGIMPSLTRLQSRDRTIAVVKTFKNLIEHMNTGHNCRTRATSLNTRNFATARGSLCLCKAPAATSKGVRCLTVPMWKMSSASGKKKASGYALENAHGTSNKFCTRRVPLLKCMWNNGHVV